MPKARTSGEWAPIDINFVSIFAHRLWKNLSTFVLTPYLLLIGGRGGIKMASASTPSVNEPTRVVHTKKLKPKTKGPISGKFVSNGIS